MACKCPEFDKETGKNFFEHKCGTDIFGTFYMKWDPDFEKYLNQINGIKDPILRYISIYFVQYYIDGYHYYRQSDPIPRYAACQYLTLWLQEKKDLFTYGGKHEKNKELWDTNFKALWNKLESNYLIKDGKEQKPWCKYFELSGLTDFHPRVTLTISEESTSQKPSISYSPPPPVETQCNCTPCEMPDNSPKMDPSPQMDLTLQTDQAPAADRTKNLAVTSVYPNDVLVQKARYE
ncbi:hypothetical protein, conserved [Plasmodium vivax]|uniref:VIR protein n=1 Tax=Plasmodium vivax TaxID=5855 RepID=A0A1G4EEY0_PLAVI|nr:hypothetical protein, conserved [Plasmodium vivax]